MWEGPKAHEASKSHCWICHRHWVVGIAACVGTGIHCDSGHCCLRDCRLCEVAHLVWGHRSESMEGSYIDTLWRYDVFRRLSHGVAARRVCESMDVYRPPVPSSSGVSKFNVVSAPKETGSLTGSLAKYKYSSRFGIRCPQGGMLGRSCQDTTCRCRQAIPDGMSQTIARH